MSEFQWLEFLAVDEILGDQQLQEVRATSTRAAITRSRFTNTYTFGGYKADPAQMMERYFDAFLFFADWGEHTLMFRLPAALLPLETANRYCVDGGYDGHVKAWGHGPHTLLKFEVDRDGNVDVDLDDALQSIAPVREEIAAGDARPLYLAWLAAVAVKDGDGYRSTCPDVLEPPVPAGLDALSGPQREMARFLCIPSRVITAAATSRPGPSKHLPPEEDLARAVASVPAAATATILLDLAAGRSSIARARLLAEVRAHEPEPDQASEDRRTVGELLDAATDSEVLAARRARSWNRAEELIDRKRPGDYDEAVRLLLQARTHAAWAGRDDEFQDRLGRLWSAHRLKRSFLDRLEQAGLVPA